MWTTFIPNAKVRFDLDGKRASFAFENLCTVFDVFAVPNSFDSKHAMGFVSAVVERLRIDWSGGTRRDFTGADFRGTYVEHMSAMIDVRVRTPATKPPFTPAPQHGFEFTSDPKTTVTEWALIGRERNGTQT